MAQVTSGIRRLLGNPRVYDLLQKAFGAASGYREFVEQTLQARSGQRLLDIGSGTSDLLAYLPAGVEYVAVEPSESYSRAARTRFGGRGHFICGFFDERLAKSLGRFDIVTLHSVLHHLDDSEARLLLRTIAAHSIDNGLVASVDPVYDPGQSPIARFLISLDRGRNVRTVAGYADLAKAAFRVVEGRVRHQPMPPYSNFIMTCRNPIADVMAAKQPADARD